MIFDIVSIVFVVLFSAVMMKKGGMKALLSLCSFVLSVVVASLAYPVLSDALYATALPENVEAAVMKMLEGDTDEVTDEKMEKIPDFVKNAINIEEEANNLHDKIMSDIAKQIARVVINASVFILAVIVTKLVLALLSGAVGVTAKLPVIKQLNGIVGLGCGAVTGIAVVWIAVAALSVAGTSNTAAAELLEGSHVAAIMSNIAPF